MKKKIRNFFEIGVILTILFALSMQGVATTKSTLSEKILGFTDAEFEWVPVYGGGSHTIIGDEIILHEVPQLVTLEIQVSSWGPNLLKTLQATVDSAGYSNGVGDTLNPLGWPGSPEDGCFIDTSRSDYVFYGMTAIDAVYRGDLDYIWGATLIIGTKADDAQTYYLGTLILEVPVDADGTYSISFISDGTKTFMKDDMDQSILPLILTPAFITIDATSNEPPNKPIKPNGQTSGRSGTTYTYSSSTTDPNGDKISYLFSWGDGTDSGWTDPIDSGEIASASHSWNSQGDYEVKVKARDVSEFAESAWSDPLSVTMPRNRVINNPMFTMFIDGFMDRFPFFARLLKLF